VDRSHKTTKDDIINCLLDFLEAPSEEGCKSTKVKAAAKKRASSTGSGGGGGGGSSSSSRKKAKLHKLEYSKGEMPDDETVRHWAQAFRICHDMDATTVKAAMAVASEKFGVDMSEKKALIKEYLIAEEND